MANILTPNILRSMGVSLVSATTMQFQRGWLSKGSGVLSGMAPNYHARLGDGAPAANIRIDLLLNGQTVKTTRTNEDGSWRFEGLDPDMSYDIIARAGSLEAVISSKRKPLKEGITVYELPMVFDDDTSTHQTRRFVVKNYKVPLTVSYGSMFPIEQTIDRSTGLVTLKITKQPTEQTYPIRFSSYDETDYKDIDVHVVVPHVSLSDVRSALEFEGTDSSPVIDDLTDRVWTSIGTPVISTAQKRSGDSSLFLNGSSYIRSTAVPTNGNFTFEAWIRPTFFNSRNGIVMFGDVNSNAQRLQLAFEEASSNQLILYWQNSVDSSGYIFAPAVALNEWSHVVIMKLGASLFLGLNGTFVSTVYDGTSSHAFLNYGVSRSADTPSPFTGYMDNMLFADKAIYFPGTSYPVPTAPYPV